MRSPSTPRADAIFLSPEIPPIDYAPLEGAVRADVCLIGAGFTGISTDLHLAERGFKVHIVEANKVGWGASGRNGGQMIGGISGDRKRASALGVEGERILYGRPRHDVLQVS